MSTAPAPLPAPATGAGDVLALIRSGRATTRGEIGRLTGLSRTAVTARLTTLERAGLVVEGEQESATGGRPASTLVLNAEAGLVLAVALGRSRSQVAVHDLDGTELNRIQTPAESLMGLEIGPEGRIWYVDAEKNQVVRISPGTID